MPVTLYDSAAERRREKRPEAGNVYTGVVIDNCDLAMQGKVRVRIPSLGTEVWARITAPGGSARAGMYSVPRPDTEVLVVFANGNSEDAYLLGGLYNTQDTPPIDQPTEMMTRRVIRTGVTQAAGHEIDFDDALQSVKITTSTQQQITLDPDKVEIQTTGGSVKITLDLKQLALKITAPNSIELSAGASIKLSAASIEIGDLVKTTSTTIKGKMVTIN
ncbi:MAG: hypothetical protein JXA93_04285 [Anaerolineae bacterium]|nr:hypothetical protein [Anaerolineae bacterium]